MKLIYNHIDSETQLICLSTEYQFIIYYIPSLNQPAYQDDSFGGMRMIRTLSHSPLLMLVPSGDKPGMSPRKMKLWNLQNRTLLHELSLKATIEECLWNKKYMVLVTAEDIFLYDLQTMTLKISFPHHPNSVSVALSMSQEHHLLIFASVEESGCLSLFECNEMKLINRINAHQSDIKMIKVNNQGNLLVSVSQTGTILRVFQIPTGEILHSFRISHIPATISFLAFCPWSQYILCMTTSKFISICNLAMSLPLETNTIKQNLETVDCEEDGFCHIESNNNNLATSSSQDNPANSSLFYSIFHPNTAHTIFDATLQSMQQIRYFSQEFFTPNTSVPSHHHAVIDQQIKRPILQAKISDQEGGITGINLYYLFSPGKESLNVSESNMSIVSQDPDSVDKELKLLVVTSEGLYQRFDLSFLQRGRSRGFKERGGMVRLYSSELCDLSSFVEDERALFENLITNPYNNTNNNTNNNKNMNNNSNMS